MLLGKEAILSRREELAPEIGKIVIDHLVKYGRADLSFNEDRLYANNPDDIIDLMLENDEIALRILALTGASNADMEIYLTRREKRYQTILPSEDALGPES